MRPHIEIKTKPINYNMNYHDENFDENQKEIFHVFIAEDRLKLLFTVEWVDPTTNTREFKVVKHDHLYLDGMDRKATYPEGTYIGNLSADPTIIYALFQDNLNPYSIQLNNVTVHNMVFFESVDFVFTDQDKLEKLYDLINEACKKIKHNPVELG